MESNEKLFAFKVASREEEVDTKEEGKWVAREGVAAAGCTEYRFPGNLRYAHATYGADRGVYC
ncbi:MAG: hypothetical protein M3Q42_10110 [Pseudomonadota bacterium]|nr:hypothetical protein [Pseudomonadota bacterium]